MGLFNFLFSRILCNFATNFLEMKRLAITRILSFTRRFAVTRRLALTLLSAISLVLGGFAQSKPYSVGLVLSGGGAKGIAHVGVLHALEENDIPIDYITGTSMGAIIGGLYACGYSPDEMMQLLLSKEFSYWSTGRVNPADQFYFGLPDASPSLLNIPLGKSAAADSVMASIISPQPMSYAFMELFAPFTAACSGDFNRLFVPFRCVASDVDARHKHVFRSGRVGDAIRASMSFPIVFQPILIDGTYYYDGGIYDNFPVDVMRADFNPTIMIGVDVSTEEKGPQTSIMDQIDNLVIQCNDYDLPEAEGIKMKIDLNEFALLDFPQASQIYKVGYDYAMGMIDSIKARIEKRRAAEEVARHRAQFKATVPDFRISHATVYGATKPQNRYLQSLFNNEATGDSIPAFRARRAYFRAIGSDQLKDFFPQATFNPSTKMFGLTLKAYPKSRWQAQLGGYVTSTTGSFLYLSLDYSTLRFNSLNAKLGAWIGQTTMAAVFDGSFDLNTHVPSAIEIQGTATLDRYYENEHLFFNATQPTFIREHQYFGRLSWAMAAGRMFKFNIGAGYGAIRSSFYRNNLHESYDEGRLYSNFAIGEVFARLASSTLDAVNYPTAGNAYEFTAMGVLGTNHSLANDGFTDIRTTPKWAQLEIKTRNYPAIGKHFALGIETDFMLSTRKLLPTYSASIATAPAFLPTAASHSAFHPEFRANSFLAAGLVPVYKINSSMSARLGGYAFVPLRAIHQDADGSAVYGKWFGNPQAWAEAAFSYKFPFATLSGYVNYATIAGDHWHCGLTFGVHLLPPRFLR